MSITNLQLLSTLILFLSTFLSISLPICLFSSIDKRRKSKSVRSDLFGTLIDVVTCFGAGVFLGASLLDLLPEVLHHTASLIRTEFHYDEKTSKRYPIGEFLIGLGFFLVLFVEQTIVSLSVERPQRKTTVFFSPEDEETTVSNVQDDNPLINANEEKDEPSTSKKTRLTMTRNFLLLLSLIIHSVFEGIALASTDEEKTFWELFFAIIIHKSIIAFTVGLKLMKLKNRKFLLVSSFLLALATPLGTFFVLTTQQLFPANRYANILHGVLRAFACGTFFYITFFDVLPHELNLYPSAHRHSSSARRSRLLNVCFVFLGFAFIGLLSVVMK